MPVLAQARASRAAPLVHPEMSLPRSPPNSVGPESKRRRLERRATVDAELMTDRVAVCSARAVMPEHVHDGTLLGRLAAEHAAEFEALAFRERSRTFCGKRTWGSLCSGSEGAHFVMEAIMTAWPDVELRQVFACESNAGKRDWIDNTINSKRTALAQDSVCIFKDISDMKGDAAPCHTHGRSCPVPGCDILVVGTSCKDLSRLSTTRLKQPVLSLHESPGGTAATFRGLLGYLDTHLVEVVVFENSDNLDTQGGPANDGKSTNLDIFHSEMAARRFESQNMMLNATQFGSAASRRRFWSVLVKAGGPPTSIDYEGSVSFVVV